MKDRGGIGQDTMADYPSYPKEPPHAYMASSPTSERTLVYVSSERKLESDYAPSPGGSYELPTPVQYKAKKKKLCSKTCTWAIIVLVAVLGISLAVSLAVVFHNHGKSEFSP